MQIRELSSSELEEAYALLSTLRIELTRDLFDTFIASNYPRDYRPVGAFERGELRIYAGIGIRENLELGRHLIIDDFVTKEGYGHLSQEMVDFLGDYAKMHACQAVVLWGRHSGLTVDDLRGFRPKRDGFIKTL